MIQISYYLKQLNNMNNCKNIEISPPWAGFIFDGSKKVEVRKNNPDKWGSVNVDDTLLVKEKGTTRQQEFTVKDTRTYDDLYTMLTCEGLNNVLPGIKNIKEAEDIYLKFNGDSVDSIQKRQEEFTKYGCIVMELEPSFSNHCSTFTNNGLPCTRKNKPENCERHLNMLEVHIKGSSNPKGSKDCVHSIEYNDETMGGCGSGWDRKCTKCGKVWYE